MWIGPLDEAVGNVGCARCGGIRGFGEDVRDTLGDVVKLASSSTVVNAGVRPYVDPRRCVPFERAPMLFSSSFGGGSSGKSYWMSALSGGRTGVVRVLD